MWEGFSFLSNMIDLLHTFVSMTGYFMLGWQNVFISRQFVCVPQWKLQGSIAFAQVRVFWTFFPWIKTVSVIDKEQKLENCYKCSNIYYSHKSRFRIGAAVQTFDIPSQECQFCAISSGRRAWCEYLWDSLFLFSWALVRTSTCADSSNCLKILQLILRQKSVV